MESSVARVQRQVALSTQPSYLQGLAVVIVMLLGRWIMAYGTGRGHELAPTLVHVRIRTRISPQPLIFGKLHVPWAMVPGVRSMARAAIALRQTVIGLPALGARCFHGTNCI